MKRSESGWFSADLWRADHCSSIMACQHHPVRQQSVKEKKSQQMHVGALIVAVVTGCRAPGLKTTKQAAGWGMFFE
jgi:hypothetical protein